MSDILASEQLVLFGEVDIPLSNDNTMKLLKVFGEIGYMPSVVQEVNAQTGAAISRMSLVNENDVNINFNSNRIVLSRSANPIEPPPQDFLEIIVQCLDRISREFDLKVSRCVISKEKLMAECGEDKMRATESLFLQNQGDSAFEWFARRSCSVHEEGERWLKIYEVSRVQGKILMGSLLSPFDRIRIKSEVGTDIFNAANRFSMKDVLGFVEVLHKIHEVHFNNLIGMHHES